MAYTGQPSWYAFARSEARLDPEKSASPEGAFPTPLFHNPPTAYVHQAQVARRGTSRTGDRDGGGGGRTAKRYIQ